MLPLVRAPCLLVIIFFFFNLSRLFFFPSFFFLVFHQSIQQLQASWFTRALARKHKKKKKKKKKKKEKENGFPSHVREPLLSFIHEFTSQYLHNTSGM